MGKKEREEGKGEKKTNKQKNKGSSKPVAYHVFVSRALIASQHKTIRTAYHDLQEIKQIP